MSSTFAKASSLISDHRALERSTAALQTRTSVGPKGRRIEIRRLFDRSQNLAKRSSLWLPADLDDSKFSLVRASATGPRKRAEIAC